MKRRLFLLTVAAAVLASVPAAWADGTRGKKANREELRILEQRAERLLTVGPGEKLRKGDKKRAEVSAHVMMAIRSRARAEGISVSREELHAQLRAWNLSPAVADANQARTYAEQEQALALRDVAETRVLFDKLADKLGGAQKAYQTVVGEYSEALPNERFQVKDALKALPAIAGALSGGSGGGSGTGGGGDAASFLGQALAPKPSAMAKTLEKTIKEFDGNPDHLPLIYPNSAVAVSGGR